MEGFDEFFAKVDSTVQLFVNQMELNINSRCVHFCRTSDILRYGNTCNNETCLIKKVALLQNNKVTDMFRLFRKRCKAVKKWHSKAWLIDPKETRLTIINI